VEGARNFNRIEQNRALRKSVLDRPTDAFLADDLRATMKRSNLKNNNHDAIRKSIKESKKQQVPHFLARSKSDIDEVTQALTRATMDVVFDHKAFHRKASGELKERTTENFKGERRSDIVPAPPMIPSDETKANLSKVHYQLACLHGMGRFPEMTEGEEDVDVNSIVFHLSRAASLRNVSGCLALGRSLAGLETTVSPLLRAALSVDFEMAKELLQRAMEATYCSAKPKAAAGCLMLQILHEEEDTAPVTVMGLLEETLAFMKEAEKEDVELKEHKTRMNRGGGFHVGDRVEANFALEGSYYSGVVTSVEDESVTVQYDDDGSSETHTGENVRPLIPMTATNASGGPLSDEEALGGENDDEKCILEAYALKAHLAELKASIGDVKVAATLYEEAADGAMNAGKMKSAAEWSSKASELVVA
jgi:elongation factor 2 kinase